MHAENLEDLYRRKGMETLLEQKRFEVILILDKTGGYYSVKAIYEWGETGEWKCCEY